ncbi:MAG: ABC transporter substrate-binding protein [Deferribacterota bacterium]|nr:ABC transporter substrate-binding protein [Deferribacterota bacterium]
MRKLCIIFCIILFSYNLIYAGEPKEIISSYSDKVIKLFNSIDTAKPRKEWEEELRTKLIDLAHEVIDFNIMARMALGPNWRKLDMDQQEKFVDLFVDMLENTYFDNIVDNMDEIKDYTSDNIRILEEVKLSDIKAEVKTHIIYDNKKIPVNYRMVKIGNEWKCYDAYIEGIGLVQNYRSQFRDLLNRMTTKELLAYLEEKVRKGEGLKEIEVE